MKKKRIFTLVIVLVLVIVAVILAINKSSKNTLSRNSEFAVPDTGSITRIFLSDKNNNSTLLTRSASGKWLVNNRYEASAGAINMLLKTLMSLEVKQVVSKAAHNNIVKLLAVNSIKVEIYQKVYRIDLFGKIKWFPHEKCTKTYYVGHATQNNLGTYMLMEGADEPFIVYIPGFNGFLNTRYSPIEKDWRDHRIFNYLYKDIASVTLRFPETPEQSFRLVKKDMKNLQLYRIDLNGNPVEEISRFDTLRAMDYLASFTDIRYEFLYDSLDIVKMNLDSVKNATPFHILTVEDVTGKITTLRTFHKSYVPDPYDIEEEPALWDRDRMYAHINQDKEMVLIQFFVFDPLLKPLKYFLPQETGEKPGEKK